MQSNRPVWVEAEWLCRGCSTSYSVQPASACSCGSEQFMQLDAVPLPSLAPHTGESSPFVVRVHVEPVPGTLILAAKSKGHQPRKKLAGHGGLTLKGSA